MIRRALHPPVHDAGFWATQAAVIALAGLHFYLDATDRLEPAALPTGIPVILLLVPVLYAALRYGLAGGAATALLATLLWLPDIALPDARGHPAGDSIELLIVVAVAVFAGIHIDRRRDAERRARTYAAMLVDAHEEERLRIARDIHDDPLRRLVDVARRADTAQPASKDDLLDVITRLRDIARELRPPGLDHLGLVAAIRGMLADVEEAAPVTTALDVHGDSVRLPPGVELSAFRIAQEAARNAVHHGAPRRITVSLRYTPTALHLAVTDDGRGFDTAAATPAQRNGPHLGLLGMRERAALLGGSLAVTSQPDRGTTVAAVLPTQPSAGA